MIAAVPVLFASPRTNWLRAGGSVLSRPEFAVGRDFIDANGERSFWFFALARWACLPLSVLGALTCYHWSADLYGPRAGVLSLWLWCFCPNILAHAQLITPDVGASSLGVAALYGFWRWSRRPAWPGALAAGAAIGLAELAKSTWLILFGVLPVLWLLRQAGQERVRAVLPWRAGMQLAAIMTVAIFVLNFGYRCKGSFRRLDDFAFHSARLGGGGADSFESGNRFTGHLAGALRLPLPQDYVQGIDIQLRDLEGGRLSYLRGELRRGGWWYYYAYGLAVKTPLGTWLLAAVAVVGAVVGPKGRAAWRDEAFVAVPAVAVLLLVSSHTGLNQHLRYILPALPFAFILMGRAACLCIVSPTLVGSLVVAALAAMTASSLTVYPHQLSYFNQLAGGPDKGHEHLLDSNIDWGQDLFELKRWLKWHPESHPLGLAYYGTFEPQVAGIEYVPIIDHRAAGTRQPVPGWYAVSVNYLYGYGLGGLVRRPEYEDFRHMRPIAKAGYSIYIYHVTGEEGGRAQ